jgi:hypothetical protein
MIIKILKLDFQANYIDLVELVLSYGSEILNLFLIFSGSKFKV